MHPLGTFSLFDAANQPIPCSIQWIAVPSDWSFVAQWEKESEGTKDRQILDSLDYARTGAKRWQWLRDEDFCAANAAEAVRRVKRDRHAEFAFALALSFTTGGVDQTIGFCHARRLWLGTVHLEFLGTFNTQGFSGIGSLLLYAIAEVTRRFGGVEIWGECTSHSQGFYRKAKAKLLRVELEDALKPGNKDPKYPGHWQLPGAIHDRFVFSRREVILMSDFLRAKKAR
jgi:hypothetical protein